MPQILTRSRPTIRAIGRRPHQRISATSMLLLFIAVILVLIGTVVVVGPSYSTDQYVLHPLQAEPQHATKDARIVHGTTSQHSNPPQPPLFQQSQRNTWKAEVSNTGGNPIKVAYAISMIECTDNHKSQQTSVAGLQDASIILRHSIHQNSFRNPASRSKYDYEMYAIVHKQAEACAPILEDAGFRIIIKDPPILASEIQGEYLRREIKKEVCCGAHEFVKLYAYLIPAPLVVHLDIDFIFRKPMDAVFDVMLGATDEETRSQVEREDPSDPWPSNIEAMITRDYTSAYPGRHAGFQAGFWVLKPSQKHFDNLIAIIREGNYVGGFERNNGWGGLGYGGFVGARAMQGLIAYYYDVHVPGTWVELNNCRYNAIRAIVSRKGKCLSGRSSCEDCRTTSIEDVYSIHFTACRKPWTCIAQVTNDPNVTLKRKNLMPVDIIHYEQCMQARKVWHEHRVDLETKLYELTKDEGVMRGQAGNYSRGYFLGHCVEDQSKGYLRLGGSSETIKRIPELY